MLRLSKLTDYAIVLLTYFGHVEGRVLSARDIAGNSGVPRPTVGKILKALHRAGLLESRRGTRGGYVLARPAAEMSVAEVISAIEGPLSLTDCSIERPSTCELMSACPVRANWRRINEAVRVALESVSIADMHGPESNIGGGLIEIDKKTEVHP